MTTTSERRGNRKPVAIAALCICASLALSQPAAAQTKLVVWHAYRGQEKAAFEEVVAAYNTKAASRGIAVKPLAVPYDAYADKITAAVPRGKGPDVFIYAQDRLGGWIEAGNTVEPLDFFLEDDIRDRFIKITLEAMSFHDTIYGLPFNYKNIAMIYNKSIVKAPPKTSGELVKLAKKHTSVETGRFGLAYWYPNWYYHSALMNAFGGKVFDAGAKPVVDSPKNIASIKFLLKWYQADAILPADPSTALVTTLFNSGRSPIVFNGPWFLGEIAEGIEYGVSPLPTIDEAGGEPMRPWVTVEGVYIAAPSQNKEDAYEFVKYVTSLESVKIMAVKGRQLPANEAVYKIPEIANDPILSAFRKQLDVAVPMPNIAEMTMMWSPVTTAMNKIIRGAASPEAAMKEAQEAIKNNIASLRKR